MGQECIDNVRRRGWRYAAMCSHRPVIKASAVAEFTLLNSLKGLSYFHFDLIDEEGTPVDDSLM